MIIRVFEIFKDFFNFEIFRSKNNGAKNIYALDYSKSVVQPFLHLKRCLKIIRNLHQNGMKYTHASLHQLITEQQTEAINEYTCEWKEKKNHLLNDC